MVKLTVLALNGRRVIIFLVLNDVDTAINAESVNRILISG